MPRPFPLEFGDRVVRVARAPEPGVTVEQVAADLGVHPITLPMSLRQADVEEGVKPGVPGVEPAELRVLCRRNRLLENDNEVVQRAAAYLSKANPPGTGSNRSRTSSPPTGSLRGDVPGPSAPAQASTRVRSISSLMMRPPCGV